MGVLLEKNYSEIAQMIYLPLSVVFVLELKPGLYPSCYEFLKFHLFYARVSGSQFEELVRLKLGILV